MQSKEKKKSGPAMSSIAKITKGDASEDALPTESVLRGPDNPTDAGGGGQDKQGEVLVIPEKAEVGEKKKDSIIAEDPPQIKKILQSWNFWAQLCLL